MIPHGEVVEGGSRQRRLNRKRLRQTSTTEYLAPLEAAPFSPPPPDGVDRARLRAMVSAGWSSSRARCGSPGSAVDAAARVAASLLRSSPDGVTLSQLREAWGTSRKWAVPLASILDAEGDHPPAGRPADRRAPLAPGGLAV